MKKVKELMKDLGFNSHGSDAVKEAFVKNLVKQAWGINVQTPTEKKIIAKNPGKFITLDASEKYTMPTQLSFDFEGRVTNSTKKSAG